MYSTESVDNILSTLVCCSCGNYLFFPIRRCWDGHEICRACILQKSNCTVCGENFMPLDPSSSEGSSVSSVDSNMEEHVSCCDSRNNSVEEDDADARARIVQRDEVLPVDLTTAETSTTREVQARLRPAACRNNFSALCDVQEKTPETITASPSKTNRKMEKWNKTIEALVQGSSDATGLGDNVEDELGDLNKSILPMLKCPSCRRYMYRSVTIRQCENGHSICSDCVSKKPRCSVCKKPFIKARNLALQRIAINARLPCRYSSRGCKATSWDVNMNTHVRCCEFRNRRCQAQKCKWTGSEFSIMDHMQKRHPSKILGQRVSVRIPHGWIYSQDSISYVVILQHFNQLFWWHFKFDGQNGKLMSSVQHVGSGCYMYKIKMVGNDNTHATRMKTISGESSVESTFKSECCFSAPANLAKHFIVDEFINLCVKISTMAK